MPESSHDTESNKPNYLKRQVVALTALAAVLTGGGLAIEQAFDGSNEKDSGSSSEVLKVGESVEKINGSVTIPAGINRDSAPHTGPSSQESTALYSDKEEIVTDPIELTTEDNPTANHWLAFKNEAGKIVFVAETKESLYQITVNDGNETKSLAETRIQPGGVTSTVIRSITPEGGISASKTELEEPTPIAIVEDRN
jgi:hypothetical protein